MRACRVALCESFKQKENEAFLHNNHPGKLMKANKAFFKDYLGVANN